MPVQVVCEALLCLLAQPACAACNCLAVTVDARHSQLDHLQDRPFSYLWAEGGAQPKLEANFGVGGAPPLGGLGVAICSASHLPLDFLCPVRQAAAACCGTSALSRNDKTPTRAGTHLL